MLTAVNPKLPMRNKAITRNFYLSRLGFQELGSADFDKYLIVQKDTIEIHFFEFPTINPAENYGQVYIRVQDIETVFKSSLNTALQFIPMVLWKANLGDKRNFRYWIRIIIY